MKTRAKIIMNKPPVSPKAIHGWRPNSEDAITIPKPPTRDNIFSKSRDTREDRGTREMKTTHNSQTLPHGR